MHAMNVSPDVPPSSMSFFMPVARLSALKSLQLVPATSSDHSPLAALGMARSRRPQDRPSVRPHKLGAAGDAPARRKAARVADAAGTQIAAEHVVTTPAGGGRVDQGAHAAAAAEIDGQRARAIVKGEARQRRG